MRLNQNILIVFILFNFSSNKIFSQKYLELRKATKLKYFSFFPGENIRFKMKDDKYFTSAKITGIVNDKLKFNTIEIPVSRIDIIDIRSKSSNYGNIYGSIISGSSLAFFAIDFINLSLVQRANYKDVYNKSILISCSIGFSIGAILKKFGKRKYFKKNELNRIWIQESS